MSRLTFQFDNTRSDSGFSPPAPEAGAARVHNDVSPVLAQTFTEQFTVYSAKRFPGVPGTYSNFTSIFILLSYTVPRYHRPLHRARKSRTEASPGEPFISFTGIEWAKRSVGRGIVTRPTSVGDAVVQSLTTTLMRTNNTIRV